MRGQEAACIETRELGEPGGELVKEAVREGPGRDGQLEGGRALGGPRGEVRAGGSYVGTLSSGLSSAV